MLRSSVLLLSLLLLLFGKPVCAVEPLVGKQQKGRVQLTGSIVDTACAMRLGNEGQTVTFQPAALHSLVRGDASFRQPLNIYLSDCDTSNTRSSASTAPALKLTFEGENNGKYFGTQGTAQGVAIQIKDVHGKLITPGMSLEGNSRNTDTMTLKYFLEIVGTGSALQAGNYHAVIKLSVQHF